MSNPPTNKQELSAELVQQLVRLSGLNLDLERAAGVALALRPMLDGDAKIAALNLGTLSPLGLPWPDGERG
ncbi:hypothetical protein [Deinococcus sp.]|uniref:hypothetical protein n=1 Tax=Deinococcus sp. TaxID=47478 RepID=UPI003B5CE5E0